jgi:hypothetical protein
MRRTVALILVAIAGVACSSTVKWQKAGVSAAEQQRDETDCTSRASLESSVPSAQRMSTTGSTPIDPTTTRVAPFDSAVYEECMRTRGYERVAPTPK